MEQLRSIMTNPFLVDTVGMSTAANGSIRVFDRTPETANPWVDLKIVNGDLYVNTLGPVLILEWMPYGCRYELIFTCQNNQKLKFEVNLSRLNIPYTTRITGGMCAGSLQLIEWLQENWTHKDIRECAPQYAAR